MTEKETFDFIIGGTYIIVFTFFGFSGLIYSIYKLLEINKLIKKHYPEPNVSRSIITANMEKECPDCWNKIEFGITNKGELKYLRKKP